MRNTKLDAPINQTATNDEQVLFGEVNEHSVGGLATLVNNVFKPMLQNM